MDSRVVGGVREAGGTPYRPFTLSTLVIFVVVMLSSVVTVLII